MTDETQTCEHAAEILKRREDLARLVAGLTTPELLAEVRCLTNSVAETVRHLPFQILGMGEAVTALQTMVARFDASTEVPLPEAVEVPDSCGCAGDAPGVLELVNAYTLASAEHARHHGARVDNAEELTLSRRRAPERPVEDVHPGGMYL